MAARDNSTLLTVRFALHVPPSGQGQLSMNVLWQARVTRLRYRMYPGPQLSLQLVPAVIRRQETLPLWEAAPGGKTYLDGDDEDVTMDVDFPVYPGEDTLAVAYLNTDASNAYDFAVDVTLRRAVSAGG